MGIHGKLLSQFAFLLLVLSSCGGAEALLFTSGRKKSSNTLDAHVSDYSKASCEYKADQGDVAPNIVPNSDIKATYFGKKYDENLLQAVLSVSATETVRFAKLTKVEFFTVSRYKTDSCQMASFLPEAHVFYQAQFASLGKGVLGLYLAPRNSLVEKTNEKPTILVRADVSRWVLVHEYMHHLFSKEVQDIGATDEDLKSQVQQADESLQATKENFKSTQSLEDGRKMLETIKTLVTLGPELLKRFTLEEMAIETILSEKLSAQKFKYVPINQAINGAAYIYTSAEKAEFHLLRLSTEAMIASFDVMKLQEKLSSEDYANYRATFKAAEEKIDGYRAELKNLKKRAEARLRQEGIDPQQDLNGFLNIYAAASSNKPSSTDHQHVGCSHSKSFGNYRNF